jgi:hypothetical protein
MMRFNNAPFNAPSREAIYKYVMQESEGPSWQYDYETFVSFDAKGRAEYAAYAEAQVKAAKAPKRTEGEGATSTELTEADKASRPLPPVLKKGTWRDALENPTAVR